MTSDSHHPATPEEAPLLQLQKTVSFLATQIAEARMEVAALRPALDALVDTHPDLPAFLRSHKAQLDVLDSTKGVEEIPQFLQIALAHYNRYQRAATARGL